MIGYAACVDKKTETFLPNSPAYIEKLAETGGSYSLQAWAVV